MKDNWFLLGDIHGDAAPIEYFYYQNRDRLYPWEGEKEMLLLFNENVVDLKKYMEMSKSDYLDDILA